MTEFQAESPIIASSGINQNESKPAAPHRDAITKSDIHVDGIEKSVGSTIERCALARFFFEGEFHERSQRRRGRWEKGLEGKSV
jgi:hypothetical protein